jgi:CubicO group peptidase (beta-lactamase class C family)
MITTEPVTRPSFAHAGAAETPRTAHAFAELDAYIEKEMSRLRLPGVALAVVDGDRIVHMRGFGRARLDGRAPSPQTPFFIGSVTKSFTALAVMQLVEAGRVELDAPVQRYLPWFRVADAKASADMTVRHLLNQTSGLPLSAGEVILADGDESRGAAERQARSLATLTMARPPGAAYEYSNVNYQLLGLIIEAASGESYEAYVQSHILTPLGMNHTYTSPLQARDDELATGHQYWFGFPFPAPHMPWPRGALAAGLLIASAEDLAHYGIAMLNDGRYKEARLLSAGGIETLQRGAATTGLTGLSPIGRVLAKDVRPGQYGMGWMIDELGGNRIVWHGGTLPHFGAFMALLPERKQGIILLFNACHHWMNPVQATFGMGAAAVLAGEAPISMPTLKLLPWMLRALLVIPLLQMADVVATARRLRRREPEAGPAGGRAWGSRLVGPTLANLLVARLLNALLGRRREYLKLYMPDFSLIAIACGGFALVWSLLRALLVIRATHEAESPPGDSLNSTNKAN